MAKPWPFKDPDEVLDYDIDWTWRLYNAAELALALAQLAAGLDVTIVPADTISSSTFTLPAGTLVANSTSNSTTATRVWLSGGTEGQSYLVVNEIVTAANRKMDQTVKLKIKTK